jgi:pimeloyl-ACP methyl ester carboxylesterase
MSSSTPGASIKPHFFKTGNISVAVYDKPGKKMPIVMIHPSTGNALMYEQVWSDPGLNDYRIIAIDLPGHGRSGWSKDPEQYRIRNLSQIVVEVADMMGLYDAVLVGNSIGGHVAIHALEFTKRFQGIMVIGTSPMKDGNDLPRAYNLGEITLPFFQKNPEPAALEAAIAFSIHDKNLFPFFYKSYAENDGAYREMVGADIGTYFNSGDFRSEIDLLNSVPLTAFVLGEYEKLVPVAYLRELPIRNLWRGDVQIIPGVTHCPQVEAPELFSAMLSEFVRDVGN